MPAEPTSYRPLAVRVLLLCTAVAFSVVGCGDEEAGKTPGAYRDDTYPAPKGRPEEVPITPEERAVLTARVPMSIVLTGGFLGKHKPCGCTSPQMGGVERLGALIDELAKTRGAVAGLCLGWSLAGTGDPQEEAKAGFIRSVYEALGLSGILLGGTDLTVDAMVQAYGQGGGGVDEPIVPINIVPGTLTSTRNVLDMRLDTQRIRAAVVLDPASQEARDLTARGITRAVLGITTAFNQTRADPDALWIVAARFTEKESYDALRTALKSQGPAIVVDLSGNKLFPHSVAATPIDSNLSLAVSLDEKGKGAGVLDMYVDERGRRTISFRYIPLRPPYAEMESKRRAAVAERLGWYLEDVKERDILTAWTTVPTRSDAHYIGSARCATCHQEHYSDWHRNQPRHRSALRTLEKINYAWDPDCVGCHVIGWRPAQYAGGHTQWVREESGFINPERTRHLGNVGCENCHGAGSLHEADPDVNRMFRGDPKKPGLDGWRSTCVRCHDAENSPGFMEAGNWYFENARHKLVPSDWRIRVRERMKK